MQEINYMTEKDPYILEKKTIRRGRIGDDIEMLENRNHDQEVDHRGSIVSELDDEIALTGDPALDRKTLSLEKLRKKRQKKESELEDVIHNIQQYENLVATSEEQYVPIHTRTCFLTFQVYGAAIDILNRFSEEFLTTRVYRKLKNFYLKKPQNSEKLEFELQKLSI